MKLSKLKRTLVSISLAQCIWLWVAYWRLWWVQIRLKIIKNQEWLNRRLSFSQTTYREPNAPDYQKLGDTTLSDKLKRAEKMHESVRLAARLHLWPTACLPRSIVLADMLKAQTLNAQVCIGISKVGNQLASHAWVELEGHMIAEPESVQQQFTPLEQ